MYTGCRGNCWRLFQDSINRLAFSSEPGNSEESMTEFEFEQLIRHGAAIEIFTHVKDYLYYTSPTEAYGTTQQ